LFVSFFSLREGVMVTVVNVGDFRGAMVKISRPNVLGNPYHIGKDGTREQVIAKYRVWLWERVKERGPVYEKLVEILDAEDLFGEVTLGCHCTPLPCHGDVIVKCLAWLKTQAG
jgi:hypothetical protein